MADLTLTHLSGLSKFRIQTWQLEVGAFASLEDAIGAQWPHTVGKVAEGQGRVLCIGPTDWILMTPARDETGHGLHRGRHEALTNPAPNSGLSVVDVSDALPA